MSVGAELREARERAGLTPGDISERTKIQLYKIEALENDELERLPGGIYLKGIVRAYAKEVGIDAAPIIERLPGSQAGVPPATLEALADLGGFESEEQLAKTDRMPPMRAAPPRVVAKAPELELNPPLLQEAPLPESPRPTVVPRPPASLPDRSVAHQDGRALHYVGLALLFVAASGLGSTSLRRFVPLAIPVRPSSSRRGPPSLRLPGTFPGPQMKRIESLRTRIPLARRETRQSRQSPSGQAAARVPICRVRGKSPRTSSRRTTRRSTASISAIRFS